MITYFAFFLLPIQMTQLIGMDITDKELNISINAIDPESTMSRSASCPLSGFKNKAKVKAAMDDNELTILPTSFKMSPAHDLTSVVSKPKYAQINSRQSSSTVEISEEMIQNMDFSELFDLLALDPLSFNAIVKPKPSELTLLILACRAKREDIAALLLSHHQADSEYVNAFSSDRKTTALIEAVKVNSFPIVEALIKNGANPNQTSFNRSAPANTPLCYATQTCLTMLEKNKKNESLKQAYYEEFHNIITLLVAAGAHPIYQGGEGFHTPLLISNLNKIRKQFGHEPLFVPKKVVHNHTKNERRCAIL